MLRLYRKTIKLLMMIACLIFVVLTLVGCRRSTGAVLPENITSKAAANAVKYADATYSYKGKVFKGIPYLWGGNDDLGEFQQKVLAGEIPGETAGIDCSGLVINAYRSVYPNLTFSLGSAGKASDIDSENMYRYNISFLPLEQLRPGDLLFYSNGSKKITHVAIFLKKKGDFISVVHAASRQGRVAVSTLDTRGRWWQKSFVSSGCLHISK